MYCRILKFIFVLVCVFLILVWSILRNTFFFIALLDKFFYPQSLKVGVLVSCGYYITNYYKLGDLKQQILFSPSSGGQKLEISVSVGPCSLHLHRGRIILCLFQHWVAPSSPPLWPHLPLLVFPLPSSLCVCVFSVPCFPLPLLHKDAGHWV